MKISQCMTAFPHTIAIDASLDSARRMMLDHDVRHLPVLDGGNLVGIISDREVELMDSLLRNAQAMSSIELAFSRVVLRFPADEPWQNVCREMIEKKGDCALICVGRQLVGIFTWVDAVKMLLHEGR